MSPLWRKHLRIALAPDQVTALLFSRGRACRVEHQAVWPCHPLPTDTHAWQAAVRALGEGLPHCKAQGAQATVVLSNHWVRYAVVPWSTQIAGAEERLAVARIIFEKNFGAAAAGWVLRLSPGGYGQASLATALERELPGALKQVCSGAGLHLQSVQPYLMSAFNQYRRRLTAPSFCLVVAERGKAGILMASQDGWHAVRSLALRDTQSHELVPLARREILLAGVPVPPRIYVLAPGGAVVRPEVAGPDVEALTLPTRAGLPLRIDTEADFGMAMSGLS